MILLSVRHVILLCYESMIILSNQASGLLDQRYLKKEYTYTILILFSHAEIHINNKETNRMMLDAIIPKGCKK